MSINSEKPGVYIDYDNSGVIKRTIEDGAVAIAAEMYSTERIKPFYSSGALASDRAIAAKAELFAMGKAAFACGASAVYIIPTNEVGGDKYAEALKKVDELNGVGAVLTDSKTTDTALLLKKFVEDSAANQRELIGFVYCTDGVVAAKQINSGRMCITAQGGTAAAAALAAAVIRSSVNNPLFGLELAGEIDIGENLTEDEISQYIKGGVTPLESRGSVISSIRTVSTKTETELNNDCTVLDLQGTRISDYALKNIRSRLKAMLGTAKSNTRSRLAIATQVQIALEEMTEGGIIEEGYKVRVSADESDPSVCCVSLEFTAARNICRMIVSADITV